MTNMDIDVGVPSPAFSLAILETIKQAQLSNGLRHGDYQRYRQYCSRRLRRIRQQLNFKFGKGKTFVPRDITSTTPALSEHHFALLLMNAERAWSYAMQIRQEEQQEKEELGEDETNSRLKFHLVGRLTKAAKWSQDLVRLCQSTPSSDRMVLEAQAYAGLIQGQLELYREHWHVALGHFKTAEHVVSQLTTVLSNLQDQDLFTSILEKDIRPYLRYCEYNVSTLAEESTSPVTSAFSSANDSSLLMLENKLQTVLKNLATQKAESMQDTDHFGIQWKGEYLMIRNKELRATFLRVQDLIVQYTKMNHPTSDSASKDSQDQREQCFLDIFRTFDAMSKLLAVQESKLSALKSGPQVDTQRYELTCLREYLLYQKSKQLVSRNIAVFQDLGPDTTDLERIHLLDMILQKLKEMSSSSPSSECEESTSEDQECASRRAVFGVLRSYYLARTLSDQRAFPQALVLIDHGQTLLAEASGMMNASSDTNLLAEMEPKLLALQSQLVANSCLDTLALSSKFNQSLELENAPATTTHDDPELARFHIPSSLVQLPPKIEAVASKPFVFDIAFHEVSQMPDLWNQMRTPEEQARAPKEAEAAPGSGFFGWFRS